MKIWGDCPEQRFRCLIIGGGPAGISVLIRSIRLGTFHELCDDIIYNEVDNSQISSVCVIDSQSFERFGGGRLQDYAINSNTDGDAFVTNILQDRKKMIPPEFASNSNLAELKISATGTSLESYKNEPAPLQLVGKWLKEVASNIRERMATYKRTAVHSNTTVQWIEKIEILKKDNNSHSTGDNSDRDSPDAETDVEADDTSDSGNSTNTNKNRDDETGTNHGKRKVIRTDESDNPEDANRY